MIWYFASEDADWSPASREDQLATGVAVGMGMTDLEDVAASHDALKRGYNKLSPFFLPRILNNMAAGKLC